MLKGWLMFHQNQLLLHFTNYWATIKYFGIVYLLKNWVSDGKLSWFWGKRDFIAVNGKRNESTLLNEHRNVTVKWLQERESSILGVAPSFFTVRLLWQRKTGKRTSGLQCKQASMSTDKVLTTNKLRHFSRRARQYICACFKNWEDLEKSQDDRMDAEVDTTANEADQISVEKLVKQF